MRPAGYYNLGLRTANLNLRRITMTIDKSLKVRRGGTSNRSVLTRAERIAKLLETERWQEGDSPIGLPKVRVRKLVMKKKKKKAKEDEGDDVTATPES